MSHRSHKKRNSQKGMASWTSFDLMEKFKQCVICNDVELDFALEEIKASVWSGQICRWGEDNKSPVIFAPFMEAAILQGREVIFTRMTEDDLAFATKNDLKRVLGNLAGVRVFDGQDHHSLTILRRKTFLQFVKDDKNHEVKGADLLDRFVQPDPRRPFISAGLKKLIDSARVQPRLG